MWSINIKEDENLILVRSGASLDYANIQQTLHQIYLENDGRYSSFDRFIDLSNIGDVNAHFDSIRDQIYWFRKANPYEDKVKTAAYLPFGILRAIVEIYVREDPAENAKLMVTGSLDECADYLRVEKAMLQF